MQIASERATMGPVGLNYLLQNWNLTELFQNWDLSELFENGNLIFVQFWSLCEPASSTGFFVGFGSQFCLLRTVRGR